MVNKHYPAKFNADAVALYRFRPGATIAQIADDLGVNVELQRDPDDVMGRAMDYAVLRLSLLTNSSARGRSFARREGGSGRSVTVAKPAATVDASGLNSCLMVTSRMSSPSARRARAASS
nr:hypothetical protein [Actinoplanes subtropicus]